MTNYLISNEQDYVGNHVYNFLREYLFDHVGEYYVYRNTDEMLYTDIDIMNYKNSKKDYTYELIECFDNLIKINNKCIEFPTPYGQYYCFYDDIQKEYFKDISETNLKESCYILDLCECVLKLIKNEEFVLKTEKISKLPKEKDRLNENSKFMYVTGGFNDNLTICNFSYLKDNHFTIVCDNEYFSIQDYWKNKACNILKYNIKKNAYFF